MDTISETNLFYGVKIDPFKTPMTPSCYPYSGIP